MDKHKVSAKHTIMSCKSELNACVPIPRRVIVIEASRYHSDEHVASGPFVDVESHGMPKSSVPIGPTALHAQVHLHMKKTLFLS
jgi:hypothetical protein